MTSKKEKNDDSIKQDKVINDSENHANKEQIDEISNIEEKKNLEEKLKVLEDELNNYKDRFLRKAAEFENYKRRTENDQLNLIKYAAESFIIKLLPVVDDFERSLNHIKDVKDVDSIKDGIRLVYEKLIKILEDQGVKPIEAIGKPFDVHFHEAVMQKKAADTPPHTVVEEFERGYLYKDRVIRHSKVAVSEDEHEESENSKTEGNENQNNNLSETE